MTMPNLRSPAVSKNSPLLALLLSVALAGCGGGGSETPAPPVTIAPTPTVPTNPALPTTPVVPTPTLPADPVLPVTPVTPLTPTAYSDVEPSCSNCAAVSSTEFAGRGVGVWQKKNSSSTAQDMQVDIGGLTGQDVTLIFTNESNVDVAMPPITMPVPTASSLLENSRLAAVSSSYLAKTLGKRAVEEFNSTGWKSVISTPGATLSANRVAQSVSAATVNSPRTFKYHDGSARSTLLKKQVNLFDGVIVNFWVETAEASETKVSAALVDQLASAFSKTGGIYEMLKDVGGPLWGPHAYPELISGAGQPIDIVVLNFTPDGQPYGEVGYFHALNNFTKAAMPDSNESLSLYLDSETIYLGGANGLQSAKMTLAHEGMHASNFYRRGVSMSLAHQYETWLEEMTAMMMEDAAGNAVDPTYNSTRDLRYPQYLSYASYNCPLLSFTGFGAACESYSVSGSVGGFMLRQMGMPFLRNLLTQSKAGSEAALQEAIKTFRPESSLGQELSKFAAAAIPAPPSATAPAGFNFPARTDGTFTLPGINPVNYKAYRVLPAKAPATLRAYANFPVVRKAVTGRFKETVRVPAGTSLSVVID
jgi:hypothetical protein